MKQLIVICLLACLRHSLNVVCCRAIHMTSLLKLQEWDKGGKHYDRMVYSSSKAEFSKGVCGPNHVPSSLIRQLKLKTLKRLLEHH